MSYRVIVCGGRRYRDAKRLIDVLDGLIGERPIATIVHGAAPGADYLAGCYAELREHIEERHPADWKQYGFSAGPIRNKRMAELGADVCVAFPGGKGTANMVKCAEKAGIPVYKVPA